LYQIHIALFAEECATETITAVQFSVLAALDQLGTVDQATLSRDVALDRSNVADVVARLESRRLAKRRPSRDDRRMMLCSVTVHGRALLTRLDAAAARAHQRTVAGIPPNEKAWFINTLHRLVASGECGECTSVKPLPIPAGILVRRVHQIYLAIYAQQCASFGTTPAQSSIMQVLLMQPGIDQVALAGEIGIDRTTTSSVLSRLEARGVIMRESDPANRRRKRASLTPQGTTMLLNMQQSIDEAHDRLVGPLDQSERKRFLSQLVTLVQANNDRGRTFLRQF
jgi:DNA-binding MarR family transcriptional regulator